MSVIFPVFKSLVEKQLQSTIKTLYSDNGGEYIKLRSFLQQNGITHLTTPPDTPKHNGLSERKHRHLVETARCLLHHARLPTLFWCYSLQTAAYLINRLPTPSLKMITPLEKKFNKIPNYDKLKTFGCLCYPWLAPYANNKLVPKSQPCVFHAIAPLKVPTYVFIQPHKGYTLLVMSNLLNLFFLTPLLLLLLIFQIQTRPQQPLSNQIPLTNLDLFKPTTLSTPQPVTDCSSLSLSNLNSETTTPTPTNSPPISNPVDNSVSSPSPSHYDTSPTSPTASIPSQNSLASNSATATSPDQQLAAASLSGPSHSLHPMVTRSKNGIHKPKKINAVSKFPLTASIEPTCPSNAVKIPEWKAAMSDEFNALMTSGTWSLVPSSSSHNVIGCKWVFRIKRNPDGSVARYKARLVAKGFHQQPGIDYKDTFSPVVKPQTIKLVLCIAFSRGWSLSHMDVNNAFLNGTISEDIYMAQPYGFVHPQYPQHVCKLHKALYGLKQAPRAWYQALRDFLLDFGFTNAKFDTSLFTYVQDGTIAYFLVYVDDILLTGNNSQFLTLFQQALSNKFSLKN